MTQVSKKYKNVGDKEYARRVMVDLVPWMKYWIDETITEKKVKEFYEEVLSILFEYEFNHEVDDGGIYDLTDVVIGYSKFPPWFDPGESNVRNGIERQAKDRVEDLYHMFTLDGKYQLQ